MSILEEKNIKAICLDIDGTLYSRFQMNLRLIPTVFPNLKLGILFNKIRKEYRATQEENPPLTEDRLGLLEKQAKIYLKNEDSKEKITKVIKQIDTQFYKNWAKSFQSIKAYDNMYETLEKAKSLGIKIALLSDFPIEKKMETLKIDKLVDFAISSEDTGYLKPSMKPFEYLANAIEVDPSNCIYIGDSYNKDIIGAKKINMKTLYLSKKAKKEKFQKADYICKNWFEIEKILLQ